MNFAYASPHRPAAVCAEPDAPVGAVAHARPAPGYHWTAPEVALLHAQYPLAGPAHCASLLPHRSLESVYAKAASLKLKAPGIGGTTGMRFARVYPVTPEIDGLITAGYRSARRRGDIKAIAARCDRPKWWVAKRAVALGLTIERIKPLPWSREEKSILEEFAACDLKLIATKLRQAGHARTPTAVQVQMKRLGFDRCDPDTWSATNLAALVGVNASTVCDWVHRRGLPATRTPGGDENAALHITRRGLLGWLREHHGHIDLRRVDQPWLWGLVLGGWNG